MTLKLKTADFRLRTRAHRLDRPTQRAEVLLETALLLLARELDGTRFRLVGVGADGLVPGREADPPGLFDQQLGLGNASISSSRALIVKSL